MKTILLGFAAAALVLLSSQVAQARHYRVYAGYPPVYSVYRARPVTVYYPRRVYVPTYPVYPVYPAYPVYPGVSVGYYAPSVVVPYAY